MMVDGKTLAVDFDGVIAQYDGWKGIGVFGEPIINARLSLEVLRRMGWKIIIFSTRNDTEIRGYLKKHKIPYDEINTNSDIVGTNPGKPVYSILLDDRAITFTGDWAKALMEIEAFRPHWEARRA